MREVEEDRDTTEYIGGHPPVTPIAQGLYYRGLEKHENQNLLEAKCAYLQAIKRTADLSECHHALASVYIEEQQYTMALKSLKSALKHCTEDPSDIWEDITVCCYHLKKTEDVFDIIAEYEFEGDYEACHTYYVVAQTLLLCLEADFAFDAYSIIEAIGLEHCEVFMIFSMADVYNKRGKYKEALALLDFLREHPDMKDHEGYKAEVLHAYASVYEHMGREDVAVFLYRQAINKDPMLAKAYYELGMLYYKAFKIPELKLAHKYLYWFTEYFSPTEEDDDETIVQRGEDITSAETTLKHITSLLASGKEPLDRKVLAFARPDKAQDAPIE